MANLIFCNCSKTYCNRTPSIRLTQQVILNAKYCIEFMIYINPVVFEPELMFGYIVNDTLIVDHSDTEKVYH